MSGQFSAFNIVATAYITERELVARDGSTHKVNLGVGIGLVIGAIVFTLLTILVGCIFRKRAQKARLSVEDGEQGEELENVRRWPGEQSARRAKVVYN
ncbi:hypothetical protein AUP68_01897 [Ilyonectria robusta]